MEVAQNNRPTRTTRQKAGTRDRPRAAAFLSEQADSPSSLSAKGARRQGRTTSSRRPRRAIRQAQPADLKQPTQNGKRPKAGERADGPEVPSLLLVRLAVGSPPLLHPLGPSLPSFSRHSLVLLLAGLLWNTNRVSFSLRPVFLHAIRYCLPLSRRHLLADLLRSSARVVRFLLCIGPWSSSPPRSTQSSNSLVQTITFLNQQLQYICDNPGIVPRPTSLSAS